ncbi:unnamed protein product [Anisakis simplex]|uniref:DUF3175 domain-containing protein n=1 Tax=Anisakis simplex TaxID=6269 RepID=A0A0M3JF31_ANISI|nr:unnamed protein product [Anisakis simplex]
MTYPKLAGTKMSQFNKNKDEDLNSASYTRAVLSCAQQALTKPPQTSRRPFISMQAEYLATEALTLGRKKSAEAVKVKRALHNQLRKDYENEWDRRVKEMEEE